MTCSPRSLLWFGKMKRNRLNLNEQSLEADTEFGGEGKAVVVYTCVCVCLWVRVLLTMHWSLVLGSTPLCLSSLFPISYCSLLNGIKVFQKTESYCNIPTCSKTARKKILK